MYFFNKQSKITQANFVHAGSLPPGSFRDREIESRIEKLSDPLEVPPCMPWTSLWFYLSLPDSALLLWVHFIIAPKKKKVYEHRANSVTSFPSRSCDVMLTTSAWSHHYWGVMVLMGQYWVSSSLPVDGAEPDRPLFHRDNRWCAAVTHLGSVLQSQEENANKFWNIKVIS